MKLKLSWIGIFVLGAMLMGMPAIHAEDLYEDTVQTYFSNIETIASNREAVIEQLVNTWFMDLPGWEEDFRSALSMANDAKLLGILNAGTYAEVQAILSGGTPDDFSSAIMVQPLSLGDIDKDFVYAPVNPCRIIDTREAGGPISANNTRSFWVHGPGGDMTTQGGNPAGCPAPRGEPRAAHVNIVAVNSAAGGYLTVYPYSTTRPLSSVINFRPGENDPISNAFTVKIGYNLGMDITVFTPTTTHVVADVLGYYYDVAEDDFKVRFAGARRGDYVNLAYNTCSNYHSVSIYAPGAGKIKVDAQVQMYEAIHASGQKDDYIVYLDTSSGSCTAYNTSGGYQCMHWSVYNSVAEFAVAVPQAYYVGQVSVSRTITVTSPGTQTIYLNGLKNTNSGSGGFMSASMQAVYYPDM